MHYLFEVLAQYLHFRLLYITYCERIRWNFKLYYIGNWRGYSTITMSMYAAYLAKIGAPKSGRCQANYSIFTPIPLQHIRAIFTVRLNTFIVLL